MDTVTRPPAPLPPESVTETTGWVAKTAPPGPPPGLVENATVLTLPRVTSRALLVTEVRVGEEAVRV